ncbi:HNH endonuclease family protein [Streptomyces olivaceoviridis]|uniref:hypothetical protein n=1 Tax=Streptomyces olivaceoviridis TaxID=1921 RepID=UPI0036FB9630
MSLSSSSSRKRQSRKPNDTCDEPGCGKSFVARGKCRKHYAAWYRTTPKHMRPAAPGLSRLTIEERFWEKVDRTGGPNACWPWRPPKDAKGYGEFFVSRERGKVRAHAFAVELATGDSCPPGKEGCHTCDNPPCCNPAHVYYGSRQQNVDDMWQRDRGRRGNRHRSARLSEAQVVGIRVRFAAGETTPALAAEFGVSEGCITDVVNGRNWKHVGGPIKTHGRPGRRPRKEAA